MEPPRNRRRLAWIIGAVAVIALLSFVGVPYIYIHFIDKTQAPLSLNTTTTPTTPTTPTAAASSATIDGTWSVASGSTAGYRVNEVLNGQSHVATGRTSSITGSLTVTGNSAVSGTFSADLTSVTSDQAQRDGQFRDRIMDTSAYPVATFTLTQPVDLGTAPAETWGAASRDEPMSLSRRWPSRLMVTRPRVCLTLSQRAASASLRQTCGVSGRTRRPLEPALGKRVVHASSQVKAASGDSQAVSRTKISSITVRQARRRSLSGRSQ